MNEQDKLWARRTRIHEKQRMDLPLKARSEDVPKGKSATTFLHCVVGLTKT